MVDDGQTDDDDGSWLYYKLTNEPKGSGELIKCLGTGKNLGRVGKPEAHIYIFLA